MSVDVIRIAVPLLLKARAPLDVHGLGMWEQQLYKGRDCICSDDLEQELGIAADKS